MIDSDAEAIATIIKAIKWDRRKEALQTIIDGIGEVDDDCEQITNWILDVHSPEKMAFKIKEHDADGLLRWIKQNIYVDEDGDYQYE